MAREIIVMKVLLLLLTVGLFSSGTKAERRPNTPPLSAAFETTLIRDWEREFGPSAKYPDYALALDKIWGKTSMARSPDELIKALGKLMYHGNEDVFVDENFISVEEYIRSDLSDPHEIVNVLEQMEVNKMKFYDYLAELLVPKQDAESLGLGALERKFIYGQPSEPKIVDEVRKAVGDSGFTGSEKISYLWEHDAYFAAKFLVDHAEAATLTETTMMALEYGRYADVAEFLDSAMMENPQKFQPTLEAIKNNFDVMERVLDNALSYGFDKVASAVIKTVDDPALVRKYLQVDASVRTNVPFKPHLRFGVMATDDPVYDLQTREEMLFRGKMEKTVRTICDLGKTHNVPAEKFTSYVWDVKKLPEYLEKFVVTDPMPSTEIYNTIMERLPNKLSEPLMNKLVVEAITHGGWESTAIVEDLKSRGATPETIVNPQGETLVHIAVKKCDSDLLRFVVEDLKVPIPKGDPTLLIALLDANSQPRYSKPGFWQTTQTLIELSKNEKITVPQASDLGKVPKNVKPTAEDMKSAAYKLLTGDKDPAVLERALAEVKVSSVVEKLSLPVRNFRRNLILSRNNRGDITTLTEILLKYRGLDTLSPVEQSAYEASIRTAFAQDAKNPLTRKQIRRIGKGLRDNVASFADLEFTIEFLESDLVTNAVKKNPKTLINAFNKQPRKFRFPLRSNPKNPLELGVSQTRAKVSQYHIPNNILDGIVETEYLKILKIRANRRPMMDMKYSSQNLDKSTLKKRNNRFGNFRKSISFRSNFGRTRSSHGSHPNLHEPVEGHWIIPGKNDISTNGHTDTNNKHSSSLIKSKTRKISNSKKLDASKNTKNNFNQIQQIKTNVGTVHFLDNPLYQPSNPKKNFKLNSNNAEKVAMYYDNSVWMADNMPNNADASDVCMPLLG